jgi:hypothetical protein
MAAALMIRMDSLWQAMKYCPCATAVGIIGGLGLCIDNYKRIAVIHGYFIPPPLYYYYCAVVVQDETGQQL